MTKSSLELMPCPFCGTAAQIFEDEYDTWYEHGVRCSNPECAAQINCDYPVDGKAWNTRPIPDFARVEKLERVAEMASKMVAWMEKNPDGVCQYLLDTDDNPGEWLRQSVRSLASPASPAPDEEPAWQERLQLATKALLNVDYEDKMAGQAGHFLLSSDTQKLVQKFLSDPSTGIWPEFIAGKSPAEKE